MNRFNISPEIEFYEVTMDEGKRYMVALGHRGGFVYYSLDEVKIKDYSKFVVHKVDNIVEFCGGPNVHVEAIIPKDSKTEALYNSLCGVFNKYLKEKLEKDKRSIENVDDIFSQME